MQHRQSIAVLGMSLALLATACGSGNSASAEVASLGSTTGTAPDTTSPVDTQDALLKYAACMRENGIDMADPTFDADGNPTGGGFGPGSGIDPRSDEFQKAQTACGDLLQGVQFGGRGRNGVDREAIQNSLNDFTACLRDEGLDVDDITFGPPGGGAGGRTVRQRWRDRRLGAGRRDPGRRLRRATSRWQRTRKRWPRRPWWSGLRPDGADDRATRSR